MIIIFIVMGLEEEKKEINDCFVLFPVCLQGSYRYNYSWSHASVAVWRHCQLDDPSKYFM